MSAIESSEQDSRERILHAARSRFAREGASASIREIAADAAVAKPMVFYYFRNKDELFRAVVEDSVRVLNGYYHRSLHQSASAHDALVQLAQSHLDVAEQATGHLRFLARCVLTTGSEHGEALRREHLDVIDALLDRMRAEGIEIQELEAARQLIRGVLSTYYMDVVSGTPLSTTSPVTIANMIWCALAGPAEPTP